MMRGSPLSSPRYPRQLYFLRVHFTLCVTGCWGLYDATTAYLNRDVTRHAIHVRSNHEEEQAYGPGGGGGWGLCGMRGVSYDRGETSDLLPLYPSLVAKLRITIFSGENAKRHFSFALKGSTFAASDCQTQPVIEN